MESLYFLIPLSLVVLAIAVWLLFWAVGNGQYDDIEREGEQILFDDDIDPPRRESGDGKDGKTND